MSLDLPADFLFGVAAASYQIEGAVDEGGRTPSIWDTFSHTPGRTFGADNGDVACDHYHRYEEDLDLMAQLGVDVYRLSLAWPRIQPDGKGAGNAAGLDFYDRVVDGLLTRGITPFVTLYHWDLPQALEDTGGWRDRDTALRFADYTRIAHERLGDRVTDWITLNEPWCSSMLGYGSGRHAPGVREGAGAVAAAHHLTLAHGLAAQALREDPTARVGVTLNLQPVAPFSSSPEDVRAAEIGLMNANLLFTDPILAGRYPQLAREVYAPVTDFDFIHDGDLETAAAPLDFLGVNNYFPSRIRAVAHDEPDPTRRTALDLGIKDVIDPRGETTTMGWPVDASGLRRLLVWLRDSYPGLPPIYITENGRAADDAIGIDGTVEDPDRIRYVQDHLGAVATAISEGVDVRGYFYWSVLDNFEWAEGYRMRFGLVYVDYPTQRRIPKASYAFFRDLITEQRTAKAS